MRRLDEMIEYNKNFVKNKQYEEFATSKTPDKKILIFSCMDTRLTELLPKALNIKNGDVKIVKNAGAEITSHFGSVMKSIIVAIYEFNIEEILVIGHSGCGMCNVNVNELMEKIKERGISQEIIDVLEYSGHDLKDWLRGFNSVEESIKENVKTIKDHPLIPKDIAVHGLVMSPETGEINVVVNGYE